MVDYLFDDNNVDDHIDVSLNLPYRLSEEERKTEVDAILHEFQKFAADDVSEDDKNDTDEPTRPPAIVLPPSSLRIKRRGIVSAWPLYHEGRWWVQDVSSTLPALALSNALHEPHSNEALSRRHVVDMCAAPGRKTAQLLSGCGGYGRVTAVERNGRRS